MYDKRKNLTYDHSHRSDLIHSEILLPDHVPNEFLDRQFLWNSVEAIEKNKNATIARDIDFALPKELSHEAHIEMVRNYVQKCYVDIGMIADINIHDKGDDNPHVHLMLTTRSIDSEGNWLPKSKKVYKLDEYGNKIYDKQTRTYKCEKTLRINDWDNRNNVELWRERWAFECNKMFKKFGIKKEVTHRSYARQGKKKLPTIHLGRDALHSRNKDYDRVKINERIKETNRERKELKLKRKKEKKKKKRSRSYSR